MEKKHPHLHNTPTVINANFFNRDTLAVARELLGMKITRQLANGKQIAGIIVETEAYVGENDRACHASRGKTARNAPLYAGPGTIYVYFTYGMHYLFNIVTEREVYPAAVLIRAVMPLFGMDYMAQKRYNAKNLDAQQIKNLANGPAKFTQAFGIDKRFNTKPLKRDTLWVSELSSTKRQALITATHHQIVWNALSIATAPRIGVAYAGECALWEYRFYLSSKPFIDFVSISQ